MNKRTLLFAMSLVGVGSTVSCAAGHGADSDAAGDDAGGGPVGTGTGAGTGPGSGTGTGTGSSTGSGGDGSGSCLLAAGSVATCVRPVDGQVACWGQGPLGDGSNASSPTPVAVQGLGADVIDLAVGYQHFCARKDDGSVWCWGNPQGSSVNDLTPVEIQGVGSDVQELRAGKGSSCVRKSDGSLWCWGQSWGELGIAYGMVDAPTQLGFIGDVVEFAMGTAQGNMCAIKSDGTLWCWGNNAVGQMGVGAVYDWQSEPIQVSALGGGVKGVWMSGNHTCASRIDGTLWCWGANYFGQSGAPPTPDSPYAVPSPVQVTGVGEVEELALGWTHSCALDKVGSLRCWGSHEAGQPGDGKVFTAAPGAPADPPFEVPLGAPAGRGTAQGGVHTCARTFDGVLSCWGGNFVGQLGLGYVSPQTGSDMYGAVATPTTLDIQCPPPDVPK